MVEEFGPKNLSQESWPEEYMKIGPLSKIVNLRHSLHR